MDPNIRDQKAIGTRLKEVQKLVDLFASGGNQSERYAHEVAERIALLFPDDKYLQSVAATLGAYRTRVGKAEAEEACRQAIHIIDFRLYGQRFAWSAIPEEHRRAWDAVFSIDRGQLRADVTCPCPICGNRTLHRYDRIYRSALEQFRGRLYQGTGGGWTWGSSCLSYEHGRASVPASWPGDPRLDSVERLEHSPEFLERALRKQGAPPTETEEPV